MKLSMLSHYLNPEVLYMELNEHEAAMDATKQPKLCDLDFQVVVF